MWNRRYKSLLPLAAIVCSVGLPSAAQETRFCPGTVAREAEHLGIDPSAVVGEYYITLRGGSEQGRIVGVEGWLSFATCRGNVVFVMDRHCRFRRHYATGDCTGELRPG